MKKVKRKTKHIWIWWKRFFLYGKQSEEMMARKWSENETRVNVIWMKKKWLGQWRKWSESELDIYKVSENEDKNKTVNWKASER